MKKEIIITTTLNETRIAMTENGELAELFVEVPDKERYVGNVYMGRVEKIIQGMNAAFVDIGLAQGAFLHFSDVDSSLEESFITEDEDEEDAEQKKNQKNIPPGYIEIDMLPPDDIPAAEQIDADLQELLQALIYEPTVGQPAGYKEMLEAEAARLAEAAALAATTTVQAEKAQSEISSPASPEKEVELLPSAQHGLTDAAAIALRLKKMPPRGGISRPLPTFSTKRSGTISINLQPRQTIIVQVVREGYSSKGVRVTTKVALPGRYMVLLPFDNLIGVSRKIPMVKERKRLRQIAKSLLPPGIGCIVRTAAEDKTEAELKRDWEALLEQWREMERNVRLAKPPALLYRDKSLTGSVIRDMFTEDVQRVVVDSAKLYNEITHYLQWVAPELSSKVEFYKGRKPLFDFFNIEKNIQETYARKVPLPSGGSIVIDQTEALHVIDVNSGRLTSEQEQEKNALRTNLEALKVAAQQIRLRDIGGMIIIDFIDMMQEENRRKVYNEMRREMSRDRAKTVIYPITQLGLMQITRQRIRQAISERMSDTCPCCDGAGRVQSRSVVMNSIERWLRSFRGQSREFGVILKVHHGMGDYLSEGTLSRLSRLMIRHFVRIKMEIDDTLRPDEYKFISLRNHKDITQEFQL